jgi:hypothetical protein
MKKSNPTHRLKLIILTIALGIAALLIARGITVITATAVYQLYNHHTQPTPTAVYQPDILLITAATTKQDICYIYTPPNGVQVRHCPCVYTTICAIYRQQPHAETIILWRHNDHAALYQTTAVSPNQTHITLP